MISDTERVDGSWELTIYIKDINEFGTIRVKGNLHVGNVMGKLVEHLQKRCDWSDHMLWWPERNTWLSHTRTTLDQYGVQSNSKLHMLKVHNSLLIMLPSLSQVSVTINFTTDVFSVVIRICKELGIRFPEELSLQKPLKKADLKLDCSISLTKTRALVNQATENKTTPEPLSPIGNPSTLRFGGSVTLNKNSSKSISSQTGFQSCNSLLIEGAELQFSDFQKLSSKSVFETELLVRPKNLIQKARLNCTWLDSSRSLMEQGVTPDFDGPLHLRFKFHSFYDLNPQYDPVRIHQLFEQAYWDLLSGRINGTEEEIVVFAALQLQIELETEKNYENEQHLQSKSNENLVDLVKDAEEEVDLLLSELEEICLGDSVTIKGQLFQEPKFEGSLRIFKFNKLGIRSQKRLWTVIQNQELKFYPSKEDTSNIVMHISIPTCKIKPEVNVPSNKYFIRIAASNRDVVRLRLDNKEDYSNWMAALRLVMRRKTLTNKALLQKEINNILDVLRLQTPAPQSSLSKEALRVRLKDIIDYIPESLLKAGKSKKFIRQKIGESHANVQMLSFVESKLKYIQTWQRLENFGITYVVVKFESSEKTDLVGIASNRILTVNQSSGDAMVTHFYSELRSWNINWDSEKVLLDFNQGKVVFKPMSTNCKTVIELIGGYVFLNQRNPEKNQELDVKLFHKLTGVTT